MPKLAKTLQIEGCWTMRYVIVESPDPREINKYFDSDVAPRIGKVFNLSGSRKYRVIDIELVTHAFTEARGVRGLLQRLN
jgi:hypothetical protein